MNKLSSQIIQMGLILLYDFIILDEKESALQDIEALVYLTRYMEKNQNEKVSLEDEIKNLLKVAKLRSLKESQEVTLKIINQTYDTNIYVERFSIFSPLGSFLMNENVPNQLLTLVYSQERNDLLVDLKNDHDIVIKSIKIKIL